MQNIIINMEKLDHYETDILSKLLIGVKNSISKYGVRFNETTGEPVIDKFCADLSPEEFEDLDSDIDIYKAIDEELSHRLSIRR